jgi:hypothetical protein
LQSGLRVNRASVNLQAHDIPKRAKDVSRCN